MAGGGDASEITREQVMAVISDRYRARLQISTTLATGPHPLPEQRLAELRTHQGVLADETSDLRALLRGLRLGDMSSMEEMPPGRLDELLGARPTDRVACRRRYVPLEGRFNMEAARQAFKMGLEMPRASSSPGAVMAASDAPPSAGSQAAAREDLARFDAFVSGNSHRAPAMDA